MLTHVSIKLMDHQNLKKGGKASLRVVWDLQMKKLTMFKLITKIISLVNSNLSNPWALRRGGRKSGRERKNVRGEGEREERMEGREIKRFYTYMQTSKHLHSNHNCCQKALYMLFSSGIHKECIFCNILSRKHLFPTYTLKYSQWPHVHQDFSVWTVHEIYQLMTWKNVPNEAPTS